MSLRVRALLFGLGAAAFLVLIIHTGLATIMASMLAVGWLMVPIILLYGAVQLCSAAAWHLIMAREPARPPFLRTYAVTISAFALNFVTPFVQAGGEPFRVAAVANSIGMRRSAGCVVLYTMLHSLSSLLLWFSALALGLVILPHRPGIIAGIIALMLVVAWLSTFVFAAHKGGVFERGLHLIERLPFIRRFTPALESRRAAMVEVDRQIIAFYRDSPGRFVVSFGLDFLGRCLGVLEFYLICRGAGVPISIGQAYLIGGLLALAINASFFVPFELGSKEAALFFIYHLAGLDPALGVAASVITRVREVVWVAVGVGLVWVGGGRSGRTDKTDKTDGGSSRGGAAGEAIGLP